MKRGDMVCIKMLGFLLAAFFCLVLAAIQADNSIEGTLLSAENQVSGGPVNTNLTAESNGDVTINETTINWNGTCPLIVDGSCPDNEFITFTLFTRSNGTGEVLDMATNNIETTTFNAANPTKIMIHGFTDNSVEWLVVLKTAYLQRGEYNAIMVDWNVLAQGPLLCYPTAAININHVAICTGQLIQQLRKLSATDIHVVGHSLGAHMANYIAQNVKPILPRITGLDPAGPFFGLGIPLDAKLDSSDATFVDVYHTNIAPVGKIDRSGHVDFYFNSGFAQPGCGLDVGGICAHFRSVFYFAESITATTKKFYGKKCLTLFGYLVGICDLNPAGTVLAGEDVLKSTTGIVEVPTYSTSPYAMGK